MSDQGVVLVEGASDRRALETLAGRLGLDLAGLGISIVSMGGITNLGRHLGEVLPGTRVTGLHDAAEAAYVHRTLQRTGSSAVMFTCNADLEDELIRALGHRRVLDVIEVAGDAASYRTLRTQPFHRDRPESDVLRRFMGTTSGRKIRYAGLLAAALDLDQLPSPLAGVLAAATR
jgi:hypothetical protein